MRRNRFWSRHQVAGTTGESIGTGPLDSFLWNSIHQLEGRIGLVDNKSNVLMGVVFTVAALVGAAAGSIANAVRYQSFLIPLASSLLVVLAVAFRTIWLCLKALRGADSAELQVRVHFPDAYVLWDFGAAGVHGPAQRRKVAHTLRASDLTDNLVAMQSTLRILCASKYKRYRKALWWAQAFLILQVLPVSCVLVGWVFL